MVRQRVVRPCDAACAIQPTVLIAHSSVWSMSGVSGVSWYKACMHGS